MTDIVDVMAAPTSLLVDHIERGRTVLVAGPLERCRGIHRRIFGDLSGTFGYSMSNLTIDRHEGGSIAFVSTDPNAGRGMACDTLVILAPSTDARCDSLLPTTLGSEAPLIYREV